MPEYLPPQGTTDQEQLDARGDHILVFPPVEQSDNLAVLAGAITTGGKGVPCLMEHGDFCSLMLDSVLRAAKAADGGPDDTIRFSTHCLSPAALSRQWLAVLAAVNSMPISGQLGFWIPKERGELVTSLRKLRADQEQQIVDQEGIVARLGLVGSSAASATQMAAARAAITAAKALLAAWVVLAQDFREVSVQAAPQPGQASMPAWYRESSWCRGALADDDDGSYRAAANAELYSVGRLNHATGLAFGSTARAFAKQLVSVTKREALRNGDCAEAYDELPSQMLCHKQVQQLAAAEWPEQLNQWCRTPQHKFMDCHALFLFMEHRGTGSVAEKDMCSTSKRLRAVVRQLPTLAGVVSSAESPSILLDALRRLVDAGKGTASSFVTLNHLLVVNKLLDNAKALCSGSVFSAKSLDDRVNVASQILVGRRGMQAAESQLGGSVGTTTGDSVSPSSGAGAKTTGGYDSARLQAVKYSSEYVSAKTQFLQLWDGGSVDDATLVLLRGASGTDASGAAVRLEPLKIFHDLLLGTKDVYVIDQDLEKQIKSARRHLPAFLGRRIAKSLGEVLERDVPLDGLVACFANMHTWSEKPPDLYNLAFVPVRVAMGDVEASLHADKGYVRGQPMFENPKITACCADMSCSVLSDFGVASSACTSADYATGNISSAGDAFEMVRHYLQQHGSLPTANARAAAVLGRLFGEFGARQAATRQSVDPKRLLETTFVVRPSLALAEFTKDRENEKSGRKIVSQMAAAGYFAAPIVVLPPLPVPPPGLPPQLTQPATDAAAERKRKVDFDRELKEGIAAGVKKALKPDKPKAATPSDEPPNSLSLEQDGDVLFVEGGKRNAAGCRYVMNGDDGLNGAVEAALPGCCPIYFTAIRGGFVRGELELLPCHNEHGSDSTKHPSDTAIKAVASIKLPDFRVNEDGSKHVSKRPPGSGGAGGGGARRGSKAPRKRKMAGGPGCRKVAFGALASLGGAFGSSTTSACSGAALLLTIASSASSSQPWGLASPGLSAAAAVGAPFDQHVSPRAGDWLPGASCSPAIERSVASLDATSPSAASEFVSSSGQVPSYTRHL